MAETRTQLEWQALIDSAYNSLPKEESEWKTYSVPNPTDFAKLIDHTLLKLDATNEQIDKLCEEAKKYGFKVWYLLFKIDYIAMNAMSCLISLCGRKIFMEDIGNANANANDETIVRLRPT